MYELESGSIEIDGVDIKNLRLSDLRSNVSLAFEESFLFSNTARENISLGLDDASQEEIEDAALIARAQANSEASKGVYVPGSQPSSDEKLFVAGYTY